MVRVLAIVVAASFVSAPHLAGAQSKTKESPVAASRFGISIDGASKTKTKGLKSQSGKKGDASGVKRYQMQDAWPKK